MANVNKPRSRDDFHIAILAALPHESDAVLEMLDGRFAVTEYKKDKRDRNEYELGYIGEHNVVVSFIGGMGSKASQNVAENLRLSFMNIKLALVVGICGGVPVKTHSSGDILLGDTIVSTQLVDLTFGRQYDNRIEIKKDVKDILGRPTIEIRNFLHKTGTKICRTRIYENSFEYLKSFCAKDNSIYPGTEKDVAYPRSYRHKHQRLKDCMACARCIAAEAKVNEAQMNHWWPDEIKEAEDAVQRITVCEAAENASCDTLRCDKAKMLQRGENRPSVAIGQSIVRRPAVHFGQIGTDSNVVKSGYHRDAVASEDDIIAFEMEGAGVWDTFPTLVVKGVCDYADSHKRKDWQHYAAASAAACMKALLTEWTPSDGPRVSVEPPSHFREDRVPVTFKLPCAKGATFDPYNNVHTVCHPETRIDLFREIQTWAQQSDSKSIFWLNGVAGTGKSTVSWSFAKWLTEQTRTGTLRLGASFFFKRGEEERNNASRFFLTLAQDLMFNIPGLEPLIKGAVTVDEHIFDKTLGEQFDKLIYRPLQYLRANIINLPTLILVVDALDECGPMNEARSQTSDVEAILSLWTQLSQIKTLPLKLFLTSRPELPIYLAFDQMSINLYQDLILHKVPDTIVEHDISIFMRDEFSNIRRRYNARLSSRILIEDKWPDTQVLETLTKMAVPLFIVAATVCRFVGDSRKHPPTQLKKILEFQEKGRVGQLDQMAQVYLPILEQLFNDSYDDGEDDNDEFHEEFRETIGSVITLGEPLSAKSLAALLQMEPGIVLHYLSNLQSVLEVPADPDPIRTYHLSFREFLLSDKMRDRPFGVDRQATHRFLSAKCLELLMSGDTSLKENMCGLAYPGQPRTEIDPAVIAQCLPPEFQYACRYWVHHRQTSNIPIDDADKVFIFLQTHFLHWLEALSLMGIISEAIRQLTTLQLLLAVDGSSDIRAFLQDARRFILINRYIVDLAPLQLYYSAIFFAPHTSVVRNLFGPLPVWLQGYPKTSRTWSSKLMKLQGHKEMLCTLAFSPDGSKLGSMFEDGTIKLWDTATGQEIHKLEGHTDHVAAIAFSSDGVLLASASFDRTLRLWNLTTGHEVKRLTDTRISAISWSLVDSQLNYVSSDGRICLWDPATGEKTELRGPDKYMENAVLSLDGSIVVIIHSSGEVTVWNLTNRAEQKELKWVLQSCPQTLAVCEETSQMICVYGTYLELFNLENGRLMKGIIASRDYCTVESVTFYQHGTRFASGLSNSAILIWDAITGQRLRQVFGSFRFAVSPDGSLLASRTHDGTIAVWDLTTDHAGEEADVHPEAVQRMTTSRDGTVVVSQSSYWKIRLWNPKTGKGVLRVKTNPSPTSDPVFSADGLLLAFGLNDGTIRLWTAALPTPPCASKTVDLWNPIEARELRKLHAAYPTATQFSQNGSFLASLNFTGVITLWNTATGLKVQTLDTQITRLTAVALSHDTSQVACGSVDGSVTLWNSKTSQIISQLKSHAEWITALALSPDGSLVAFASMNGTLGFWDPVTDQQQTIEDMGLINSINLTVDKRTIITNRGEISFHAGSGTSFIRNSWIQYNGRNYLWLPQEYSTAVTTFCDGIFSFGLQSGQVAFIKIQNQGDL